MHVTMSVNRYRALVTHLEPSDDRNLCEWVYMMVSCLQLSLTVLGSTHVLCSECLELSLHICCVELHLACSIYVFVVSL